MGAKGSGNSTTHSGISGGTVVITDEAGQQARTGQSAAEAIAALNRDVSSDKDGSNTLKPIFDKDKIEAGFAIVGALQRETGTFLSNRAKEADALKTRLDSETDPERKAILAQQYEEAKKWAPGGDYNKLATVLTTATGGNVMGGLGDLAQRVVIGYVQGLGAAQIKALVAQVGDGPQADAARAVLQGLLACGGAAASGGNCGNAALSVAGGVGLNAILNTLLKDSPNLSAEEKIARENLVGSIITGISAGMGGDAASGNSALQIEMAHNEWGGRVYKQQQYEHFSEKNCAGLNAQACQRKFGEVIMADPGARAVLAGLGVLQVVAAGAVATPLVVACLRSPVACNELAIAAAEVVGGAGAISGPRGVMGGSAGKAAEGLAAAKAADKLAVSPSLLKEMSENGVKFTPDNVVAATRTPDGKIVFLETGDSMACLQHVIQRHVDDFANIGVQENKILKILMQAITEGKVVGYQGQGSGRAIYEIVIHGQKQQLAITVGSNGFIVGANPAGRIK